MRDYSKDFGRGARTMLKKLGAVVIGAQLVPNADGTWINPELAYLVAYRDTQYVRSYSGVLEFKGPEVVRK